MAGGVKVDAGAPACTAPRCDTCYLELCKKVICNGAGLLEHPLREGAFFF